MLAMFVLYNLTIKFSILCCTSFRNIVQFWALFLSCLLQQRPLTREPDASEVYMSLSFLEAIFGAIDPFMLATLWGARAAEIGGKHQYMNVPTCVFEIPFCRV
ncbi:hypothetical protein O6H91_07G068500 [Diphasiastrum complanatum]|uniref:Uncharacterized protein n=1 Tax=Diphasiastrum complanatum TaxID=34168 RepID=A0ACC2D663_DIPCM|nr:hypothetical protein O6H91_07G068500 [Diphasiastrum complanatum]